MEATTLMNPVVEMRDRYNHAPGKLPNDAGLNTEPRQSVAADGQNIPPSAKLEAGRTVSGEGAVSREETGSREGTISREGTGSREDLKAAVRRLSDYVQSIQRTLDFSVDEATGRTVITVTDAKTERVIRQIPPEEVLHMLDQIAAGNQEGAPGAKGLFVQEKA